MDDDQNAENLNRQQRRQRGQRGPKRSKEERRKTGFEQLDFKTLRLTDMRFDTPEASRLAMGLRLFDPRFKGSTDSAARLPPSDESVSATPGSGGMVYKAFPHGLMYGDQMALMDGILLMLAPLLAMPFLMGDPLSLFRNFLGEGLFFGFVNAFIIIVMAILYPLGICALMTCFIGHRFHTSALLDRRAGKVHIFRDETKLWTGTRGKVVSYDWSQVRAELDSMSVFTGTVGREESGLRGVVLDPADPSKVIDRFPLTVNMSVHNVQPLLDTWEHARRFMQHEGPLFADEDDGPNPALGKQPFWRYLWEIPELWINGIRLFHGEFKEHGDPVGFIFMVGSVVMLPLIPVMAVFGLFPWISSLFKREPKWPAEVLNSVGGSALKGRDLAAWRNVVPERASLEQSQATLAAE
jgi:hypothetical protein